VGLKLWMPDCGKRRSQLETITQPCRKPDVRKPLQTRLTNRRNAGFSWSRFRC